jgi:glycosyltransferase involved in cell wall biosynthesis
VTWWPDAGGLTAPVTVAEIDLADPAVIGTPAAAYADRDPEVTESYGSCRSALVLARLHAMPVGTLLVDAPGGQVDPGECAKLAWDAFEPEFTAHLRADGLPPVPPVAPQPAGSVPACHGEQDPHSPVPVSVVVATRERADKLAACLDSLALLDYPDFEVVVIDNDPVTSDTESLIRERADDRVRYVREPCRGLASAHNRGLAESAGRIVAFTDDDVIVDSKWLLAITRAMREEPDAACVTGLILPAELITQAQLLLEFHGHFSKGFSRRVVNTADRRPADPLFPFTVGKLGSGANMAFDRDRLLAAGGFDRATGAGTVARGGDDLAALFGVLAAGHSLAYEPAALVWHRHRRDVASLSAQAYGYGVGLSAYLTSAMVSHPGMIGRAMLRAPAGLAYALRPDSDRNRHLDDSWPRELIRLERKGMAVGPFAYAASRWRSRHAPRAGG